MPCGNNKMGFSVRYVRLLFDSLAAEKRQTLKFMAGAAAGGALAGIRARAGIPQAPARHLAKSAASYGRGFAG